MLVVPVDDKNTLSHSGPSISWLVPMKIPKKSHYLTAQQRNYLLTSFFQAWEKRCKHRKLLWSCTELTWVHAYHLKSCSCVFGKRNPFFSALCETFYIQSQFSQANNYLLLREETLNTCVNMIHSFKTVEEKVQVEPGLIKDKDAKK